MYKQGDFIIHFAGQPEKEKLIHQYLELKRSMSAW